MAMTSLAWPPASLPCLLLLLLITLQVDSLSRNHKELEFSIEDVTRVRMTVTCHVSRVTSHSSGPPGQGVGRKQFHGGVLVRQKLQEE